MPGQARIVDAVCRVRRSISSSNVNHALFATATALGGIQHHPECAVRTRSDDRPPAKVLRTQ